MRDDKTKQTTLSVIVRREDPRNEDAQVLLDELSATLATFTGDSGQSRFTIEEACSARGAFVVARTSQGELLGCGAFRRYEYGTAEIKRIYVRPRYRGVGTAIVKQLELEATTAGYRVVIAASRASNRRAIDMYLRNGYSTLEPFGFYATIDDARCFIKSLCDVLE